MFNPSRLTLARTRRGLTKADLSEQLSLSPRTLHAYEAGEFEPSEDVLGQLSQRLSFPVEFFGGPTIEVPIADGVSFRSLEAMTASQRDAALGASAFGISLSEWIGSRFALPALEVPDLRGLDPESAANALRAEWGLGERPVKNMVHLLESRGVRVFSLTEEGRELDAFSFWWRAEIPYVFLNTQKSAEHGRFDAAHELGHLVLHRHGGARTKATEHEADRFASAFLMPRGSVIAAAPRLATVRTLIEIKPKWNVSVAALNVRLHALGLTSDWKYRNLCIEISRRGYRTSEPQGSRHETSLVLQKVFQRLREEDVGKADVARELLIYAQELDSLVFGLVMRRLEGGSAIQTPRPPSANLRRV